MADNETNRLSQLKKQLAKSRALKAQGVQFVVDDYYDNKIVKAMKGDTQIGSMELKPPSDQTNFKGAREIKMIWTDPSAQRQGVATSLFNEARKLGLKPVHSSQLSSEGAQFKAAVGGPTVKPELTPTQREMLGYHMINKQTTKASGKERAAEIAKLRAAGRLAEISTPEARRNLKLPSSPSIRPGVAFGGAANILSFLPMILEGGKIAQGTSSMLPRFDRVN